MNQTFLAINRRLMAAQRILLVSHQKPDGDALGATLSLIIYLRSFGKTAEIFTSDAPPSYFNFLPEIEAVRNDPELLRQNWDLILFVDTCDFSHAKIENLMPADFAENFIINFDHHLTNAKFGRINYVDEHASSACEIVYHFFQAINYDFDRKIAVCLLNGILSDTGGFVNGATTISAIEIASALARKGARIYKINGNILKNKSINGLRLWGLALSRLAVNQKTNSAHTYLTEADLKNFKVNNEEIDGLTNFLNVICDVDFVIFFRVYPGRLTAGLRTNKENIDVAKIAGAFGGGGHKKAAGFSVPWEAVVENGQLRII